MTSENTFSVKFWGVRGSHPVPGKATQRYGGNTPCVEVRVGGHSIILDAGTGIIELGQWLLRRSLELRTPTILTLLFSHFHHDHTQGFPFFTPAYIPTTRLNIFVPDMYDNRAEDILVNVMASPTFPMTFHGLSANKVIHNLSESEVIVFGDAPGQLEVVPAGLTNPIDDLVRIRAMRSYGHPQGVMVYRIEWRGRSMVYATDTEGYLGGDRRLINFARYADLLIHDAQYTDDHYLGKLVGAPVTQGFGHSTAAMACETARAAGIGKLVLFHHDPNYDDAMISQIESRARKLFPNTIAAYEGQEIHIRERVTRPVYRDEVPVDIFKKSEVVADVLYRQ